jgi:hypothetical protein
LSCGGGCWRWYVEYASSLLHVHVSRGMAAVTGLAYPINVSASKAVCERWSYWSMGTMGIAICWSGPVTVWCGIGIGIGMYDMVLVSKCSMAECGLAVDGGGVGAE